jgi:hypothetical protein
MYKQAHIAMRKSVMKIAQRHLFSEDISEDQNYRFMKVYLDYVLPTYDGLEQLEKVAQFGMENMMEKYKYQTMWKLRSIENEINESEGIIIIMDKGKIHTKDFTQELSDKIKELLSQPE